MVGGSQKGGGSFHGGTLSFSRHHIVCTPLFFSGRGVEPPTKFSKRGGSTGSQFLEGVAGKEQVTFFRGLQFLHKKLLKYLTTKKCINKKTFFSVITKILNREILTQNLVTFKRRDGVEN